MPNPKQHQDKAVHNREFLLTISDPRFCDWKATVAFYVAVHLVEKLRAYGGRHSKNHEERDRIVRSQFPAIYNSFHQLYNASLTGRYKSVGAFKITPPDVQARLIDTYLVQIETFVASHVPSGGGASGS